MQYHSFYVCYVTAECKTILTTIKNAITTEIINSAIAKFIVALIKNPQQSNNIKLQVYNICQQVADI